MTILFDYSLFETLALGFSSNGTSAVMLASSIALHQPAESIALLVAFLKTSMSTPEIIKWLSFYSIVGPLGVSLGVFISRIASPIVEGIMIAATAGTFLYVGATEVSTRIHIFQASLHHHASLLRLSVKNSRMTISVRST